MRARRYVASLAALSLPFAIGACASDDEGGTETAQTTQSASTAADDAPVQSADAVTATDGWVKAVTADEMMTAVFVSLHNDSEADVQVVSATTDMSDLSELHEMVELHGNTVMQEAPDGLVIPAGESIELEPGGLHVMVMGLTEDVVVGEIYTVTLTFSDGSEIEFDAVAKDFAGANEEYHDDHGAADDHGADSAHDADGHSSEGGAEHGG